MANSTVDTFFPVDLGIPGSIGEPRNICVNDSGSLIASLKVSILAKVVSITDFFLL